MPYYRIIIWVKQEKKKARVVQGIRFLDMQDIDVVYRMMWKKAIQHYGEYWVSEVEVQMLSKLCPAVKEHVEWMKHKPKPALPVFNSNRQARKGEALVQQIEQKGRS